MRYRKKPVEVEAVRFINGEVDEKPGWILNAFYTLNIYVNSFGTYISTLEGDMRVSDGDYIIRGVQGEIYPCKPDIFEQTYEAIEEE